MKKLALILALMIIPCSAFGLEMLNDSTMDQVTGQAGVSIAFDDVQIFINIEKMAWIDCDGIDSYCTGAAGAIALNNFQIDVLNVNAIVSGTDDGTAWTLGDATCSNIDLFYDYPSLVTGGCYLNSATNVGGRAQTLGLNNYIGDNPGSFDTRALTIDATDELPVLTAGFQANTGSTQTVGGIIIGIPTMEIYINAMTFTPVYDGDINGVASNAVNDDNNGVFGSINADASFGTIYLQGITFTTLSGWLEIAPH